MHFPRIIPSSKDINVTLQISKGAMYVSIDVAIFSCSYPLKKINLILRQMVQLKLFHLF